MTPKVIQFSSFTPTEQATLKLDKTGEKAITNIRNHYPDRASVLDFKDAAAPRFGHIDAVFDQFIETCFSYLIALLSNFSKLFINGPK